MTDGWTGDIVISKHERPLNIKLRKKIMEHKKLKTMVNKSGYDYDSLTERDREALIKAEKICDELVKSQKDCYRKIRDSRITVEKVGEKLGIARRTVYKNPILVKYIGMRTKDNIVMSYRKKEDNEGENPLATEAIARKDIEIMGLKEEIEELKATVKNLKRRLS